jgi:hypothetical protein
MYFVLANPCRLEDVDLSPVHPKKAFIVAAIDKEIRLSFAKRIRETLPEPYHKLIPEGKFKDTPDFKYKDDRKYLYQLTVWMLNTSQKLRMQQRVVKFSL